MMFTCGPILLVQNSAVVVPTTWNPSDKGSRITLSNGDKTASNASGQSWHAVRAVRGQSSTNRYFEIKIDALGGFSNGNAIIVGVGTSGASITAQLGTDAFGWGYQGVNNAGSGNKYNNNVQGSYGPPTVANDVVGILLDFGANTLTFYVNGTGYGAAYSTGFASGGPWYPMLSLYGVSGTPQITARFDPAEWTNAPAGSYSQW